MSENKYINLGINTIMLIMGQACNLQCKYCLKHTMVNDPLESDISDTVYDYLDFLCENSPVHIWINYYGGEPLLYFDGIKKVIAHCESVEKKYGNDTFSHGMISNGKALTEEIVNYLNEKEIGYCISWDGKNSDYTRGYDALVKKDLIMKIDRLGFSTVLTSKAYPYDVAVSLQKIDDEYFKIHGYHITVNYDDLMNTGCGIELEELLKIDFNEFYTQWGKLFDIYQEWVMMKDDNARNAFYEKNYVAVTLITEIINQINGFVKNDGKYSLLARCSQGRDVINMDLQGNLYECHNNTDGKLGNISDFPMNIITRTMEAEYPIMHRKATTCKGCEAMAVCGGGCKLVKEENLGLSCKLAKTKYEAVADKLIKLAEEEDTNGSK